MSHSRCGDVTVNDVDLTDYIREMIPIENLLVFGGGSDEDEED